ncbi:MAG: hypothetical protein Q4C58_12945 [Eubacteriales bacterium]|nr:hypothetical protein [Eubacteriales bacterium]
MEEQKKKYEDSFYKVGVKLLTDAQLANIFPNHMNLMEKIESYRAEVGRLSEESRRQDQYNLMYDNVFSIMGKRGTGKTSVAFTLKRKIEQNKQLNGDIVLPIIIPEMIPNECSMLVWILAIVKENVENLERELNQYRPPRGQKDKYWDNCHFLDEDKNSLSRKVEALMELLFAGNYNPANESSFYKAVGNSVRQAGDHYRFSCKVAELWDEWVEAIGRLYRLKNETEQKICPLIYFIFDDVDLEPQKVAELLSVIIKYLSHPNIIVITTADEELFLEVIANNMDRDMGRLPKEWRGYLSRKKKNTEIAEEELEDPQEDDLIAQTARMYLGKVLPTSTRYYLRLFGRAEDKRWFRLSDSEYLGDSMCRQVDALLEYVKEGSGRQNFMVSGGRLLNFYLEFMGDTSRQIGNAYLGWKEFMQNMVLEAKQDSDAGFGHDACIDRVYHACRYFLYVGINANHELAGEIEHIDEFISEIFWMEFNEWNLYVNYSYLSDFLDQMCREKRNMKPEKQIRVALKLFSLLLLLENILLILEDCIPGGITGRKRVHGVNIMVQLLKRYAFDGRELFRRGMKTEDFFIHYSDLLDKLDYIVFNEDRSGARFCREYLSSFTDYDYTKIELSTVNKMMNENREWFNEITGMLAMVYGNGYVIEEKEVRVCTLYRNEKLLAGYQRRIRAISQQQMQGCLEAFNLRKTAEKRMERLRQRVGALEWRHTDTFENACDKVWDRMCSVLPEEAFGKQEIYVTMEEIIIQVFRAYGGMPLESLISYCPKRLLEILQDKLVPMVNGQESVEEALQVFAHAIEQWDFYEHKLSIFDMGTWLEKLREVDRGNLQMERLADRILRDSRRGAAENGWSDGARTILPDTDYNRTLKGLLIQVWETAEKNRAFYLGENSYMMKELQDLLNDVDIAINLSNKNQYRDAVTVAIEFLLFLKFQQIYLDQTILTRYGSGYRWSSVGLEMMKERNGSRISRSTEKNSYYYQLYLTMERILDSQSVPLSALQNFLSQAARREKRKYLNNLMKGELNEQISY